MNLKKNPELIPLIEFWEKDGKQLVIGLLTAAVVVGGIYGTKGYLKARKEAARSALANAYTTEELEEATSKHSGTATGPAIKIRLAKSYFDNGNYEAALTTYEELTAKAPQGFEDIPVIGKAQCLEALGKYAEAQKIFEAFATDAAKTNNYLKLTAQLGAARTICLGGDKKTALARLDALKTAYKDDEISKARVEALEATVKRHGKPAAKPAAKPVEKKAEAKPVEKKAEVKPVEKKAEVKKAEVKKAEAAKPAAKPAPAPAKKAEAKK